MEYVAAGQFKQHCLKLMDNVAITGETLVITKRGKPVARLCPVEEKPRTLFGIANSDIEILGDIVSPTMDWGDLQ